MNGLLWRVGAIVLVIALVGSVFYAWRGARREQAELKQELKATQAQLAEAAARQEQRDAKVGLLVEQLAEKKDAVKSPVQVVAALPDVLPLPRAIRMNDVVGTGTAAGGANQEAMQVQTAKGKASGARATELPSVPLPVEDLKPLYDFAVDCKACQAKLVASQADLKDEQAKTVVLGRERDDALRAAKGGSVMRRVVRAAKWFAIGAAAGAIAARAAR